MIDSNAIYRWQQVGRNEDVRISNDGNFVSYTVQTGYYPKPINLVIQSTFNNWKIELPNAKPGIFSSDCKKYVFFTGDSLVIATLGSTHLDYVSGVLPYSFREPKDLKGRIVALQLKKPEKELILIDLLNLNQRRFKNVSAFQFSDSGNALLLKIENRESDSNITFLKMEDVSSGTETLLWKSSDPNYILNGFAIDKSGKQIAMIISKKDNDKIENSIWHWHTGMDHPVMKINGEMDGMCKNLQILPSLAFSNNGKFVLFHLQPANPSKPLKDDVSVDIWSTRDTVIQSTQLLRPYATPYIDALNLSEDKVVKLTGAWDDEIAIMETGNQDYAVVKHNCKGDRFWLNIPDSNWLVSLKDGSKTLLASKGNSEFWFSPNGRYLIYYDASQGGHYFSVDLETKREIKVSNGLQDGLFAFDPLDQVISVKQNVNIDLLSSVGLAGFSVDGNSAFVYDNYDIWKLDLTGEKSPINITNGYGRLNHIKFRIPIQMRDLKSTILEPNKPIILTAYNTQNKYNGFYQKDLSEKGNPKMLSMGPFYIYSGYHVHLGNTEFSSNFIPLKSANTSKWIIKRESTNKAPNYFLTSDFKNYHAITDLQPQKNYRWLTAELIHFMRSDSVSFDGVLYKPENFDSSKKYPVIINIYEMMSQRMYQFPETGFIQDAHINIPWFTSRGYLVFTPDIRKIGDKSKSPSLLTIEAAVSALGQRRYIDPKRIGLTGHSTAGGTVTYIISHSNLFCAAFEGAGNTDNVSSTLEIDLYGNSRMKVNEYSFGANIWQRPDLYLDNAIMHADKIITPLLIFHCKGDGGVLFQQAIEFYLSLRRLGKIAWMLQYDRGNHEVFSKEAEDLSVRTTQFFDHYLKGAPAPIWMTRGIPARFKGIEFGYSYDPSGKCGTQNCKICKYWNEKFKKDSAACWKEITAKTKSEHWMANGEAGGH